MGGLDLLIAGELLAIAALYLEGVRRLVRGRTAPVRRAVPRAGAFLAGLLAIAVALIALEDRAGSSLTGHMVQHLLLLLVAPALLVAGAPHRVALGALPGVRAPLARAMRSRLVSVTTHPAFVLVVLTATLLVWHLPGPYDAAASGGPLHALEHGSYLLAGVLLWVPLLALPPSPHRLSPLPAVLYLLVAMLPGALIGIRLMTADQVLYDHYAATGLDPAAQHEAGMVMWAGGTLLLAAAAVAIGWSGVEREERRQRRHEVRGRLARTGLMIFCAGAAIALAAGRSERSAAQEGAAPPQLDERTAAELRGQELFEEGCSDCHGLDARGIPGRGPSLFDAGEASADFYLRTGRMPLQDPKDQPERGEAAYDADQIDALVAYVGSLGEGPEIPSVDPEAGSLAEGQRLFSELCAGCHQIVGQGGIVTGGTVPDLHSSEPIDVAEAVVVGPFVMPLFERLDQSQVDSLARYALYTQDPEDRGGWGIGNIGPIPEGMVAWLLAGAALLLAIRLIGERTTR